MQEISILAKGDEGEHFQVVFARDEEEKLTVSCSCPDASAGDYCVHRARLAANDLDMLFTPVQARELFEAHLWVVQSALADPLLKLMELEGAMEPDPSAVEEARRRVAEIMRVGG